MVTLRNCSWLFIVTLSLIGDDRAVRKAVGTMVFIRGDGCIVRLAVGTVVFFRDDFRVI